MTVHELIERLKTFPPEMLVTLSDTEEHREFTPVPVCLVEEEIIDRWWEVGVDEIPPQETSVVLRGM
jgi:hypothetical protein